MNIAVEPTNNKLLAHLLQIVGPAMVSDLKLVELKRGQVLHESGAPIQQLYFPVDALVSLVYGMENGSTAEAALIGNDGMVGVALFLGGESTPYSAEVQSDGKAYRLRGSVLQNACDQSSSTHQVILRYAQALFTQMAQTAACGRHHTLTQQLCRWLLACLDRLPGSEIRMTQEGISHMLGVRRESVTVAAHQLQEAGVIRYTRGRIKVLDRSRLEHGACECYSVVRAEIARLGCVPERMVAQVMSPSVRHRTDDMDRSRHAAIHVTHATEPAGQYAANTSTSDDRRLGDRRNGNNRRGGADQRPAMSPDRRENERRELLGEQRQRTSIISFPNRRDGELRRIGADRRAAPAQR